MAKTASFLSVNDRVLPGVKRLLPVANPAAGTDWSAVVPGGRQWRVLAGQMTFQASAAAASRFPGLAIISGGGIVWAIEQGTVVAAGQDFTWGFAHGIPILAQSPTSNVSAFPVPDLWLLDGMAFGSSTPNVQAGDQYSNVTLYIEECYVTDAELSEAEDEMHRLAAVSRG